MSQSLFDVFRAMLTRFMVSPVLSFIPHDGYESPLFNKSHKQTNDRKTCLTNRTILLSTRKKDVKTRCPLLIPLISEIKVTYSTQQFYVRVVPYDWGTVSKYLHISVGSTCVWLVEVTWS